MEQYIWQVYSDEIEGSKLEGCISADTPLDALTAILDGDYSSAAVPHVPKDKIKFASIMKQVDLDLCIPTYIVANNATYEHSNNLLLAAAFYNMPLIEFCDKGKLAEKISEARMQGIPIITID
jgi:hypothetical protein